MEEVMGFLTWDSEGIHRQNKQQGRAFKDFSMACYGAGYQMYYFDLQLAHLSIPQYRERLWCVPIRDDVCEEMGDFPTPQLPTAVSPQIGPCLLQDQSYYTVVAQMSALTREEGQVHQDFKPHLVGTVRFSRGRMVPSMGSDWSVTMHYN
jgi:site-specific DNA-cytosine methylase